MSTAKQYDASVERAFDDTENIDLCVCCGLSTVMMPCNQDIVCPFQLGRAVREVHLHTLGLDVVAKEAFWATLPKWLWDAYYAYLNKMQDNTWGVSGPIALTRVFVNA